jgi:BirA family transcriptional regulator, biotin operon repressor / biotin---[acetyl-CoA-carboxylase] ligase
MAPVKPKGVIAEFIELYRVDSTNQYALDHGRPGLLVTARIQDAGRGRRGRPWFSPDGENVYMTLTLAPPEERYPIIAGVAVRCAIAGLLPGEAVAIKWPNDIIISGKKVCGILCETKGPITAVGIGVNVNQQEWPKELEHRACSMKQYSPHGFNIHKVIESVSEHLCTWIDVFRRQGFGPVREEFLRHGLLEGYEVSDERGQRCTIVDLTMDGHLIIKLGETETELIHEPVSLGWDQDL